MRLFPETLTRRKAGVLAHYWRLLLFSWLGLMLTRLGLRLFGFHRVHRFLDRVAQPIRYLDAEKLTGDRIAWGVGMAARCLPGRSTCLARALATRALLRSYGHTAKLRLGVRRTENEFEAHAWLEGPNGEILIGELPNLPSYAAFPPTETSK